MKWKVSLTHDELNRWKHSTIDQGYLLHKGRVCVPQDADIWRQTLYECHDSPSVGHPRIRKTYAHARRNSYWASMQKYVHGYVTHCQKCQVNKAERLKAGGILQPLEDPKWKVGKYLYGFYCWIAAY